MRIRNYIEYSLYPLFFIISVLIRWASLTQTKFANGWDSYFYLVQVKSLFEEGAMHTPNITIVYPLLYAFNLGIDDYIISYKVLSVLFSGLFILGVYRLGLLWSKNLLLTISVSLYLLFSPHLTYFTSQYLKNLIGMVFLVWSLTYVKKNTIKHVLLLILNIFGHRLTFILSLIFTITYFNEKKLLKTILPLFLSFITLLGVGYFIPGIMSFADLSRFSGAFTTSFHFSPITFLQEFGEELVVKGWKYEIIFDCLLVLGTITLVALQVIKKQLDSILLAFLIVMIVLLLPFLSWDLNSLSFRFFLVFPLLTPIAIYRVKGLLIQKVLSIILIPSSLILAFGCVNSYQPDKHDPNYSKYAYMSNQIVNSNKNIELLIVHKSFAEIFTYTTGIDGMPWLPEYKIDKNRLWRVAKGVGVQEIEYFIGQQKQEQIQSLGIDYILIREDLWQAFIVELEQNSEKEFLSQLETWENPYKIRPLYLLKDKRK
ncbi:MAG: hypothetical protein COB15_01470 [Flavobacteriales bacterium]|nr:MAG: hypothetical protein COB15_01470 [Flavobacteriales bacterium]